MNIDDLTYRQIKEILSTFGGKADAEGKEGINDFAIGQKVIIRTYSAGVHYGTLTKKAGEEVILTSARRMWKWKTKQGISLSECATYGVDAGDSRICAPVEKIWLKAVEILSCTPEAITSIEGCTHASS